MTQEDKELLLKDLCARLPYGVKILARNPVTKEDEVQTIDAYKWGYFECSGFGHRADIVRPYLRPMSSMTEEEKQEMSDGSSLAFESALNGISGYCPETMAYSTFNVDFCLTHHLDYRGLIKKGLAIEVTEENNPYN